MRMGASAPQCLHEICVPVGALICLELSLRDTIFTLPTSVKIGYFTNPIQKSLKILNHKNLYIPIYICEYLVPGG